MKSIGPCTTICTLLLLLFTGTGAHAVSVAVFPVDDLTAGRNSLHRGFTDFLGQELAARGLTVIPRAAVSDFMAARRIRRLGMLQTEEILAAGSELHADLVVLGSLCQRNEASAVLGVSVSLIRTRDGRTIWSSNKGVSLLGEQRLLGVNAPASMADLTSLMARELFQGWPADLRTLVGKAEGPAAGARETARFEVESVLFSPTYARPGQEVKCTIRFTIGDEVDPPKVFLRVGNHIHMATSVDGLSYQVTWVGSDGKVGTPLQVAMNSSDSRIINALWSSAPRDAAYPVTLILEWPSGRREESYLGSYVVDGVAPQVRLKTPEHKVNGVTVFRTELPISPLLIHGEPIVRWQFAITTRQGQVVVQDKGEAQPPRQFVWQGQNRKGQRVLPGLYTITLKVWDRAENVGEAWSVVQLLDAAPGLDLSVERRQGEILALLTPRDGVPIPYWRLELWSEDNDLLHTVDGHSLPARVELPHLPDTVDARKIDCLLKVRDSLGSEATSTVPHLLVRLLDQGQSSPGQPSAADRDDGGGWQADF